MRLLVTRPEPDNERTATALRAMGHDVVLAPMLRIEFVRDAELGAPPWAGILLTSANGERALSAHARRAELLALPVLTVGGTTAEAARHAGFTDVTSADGSADELVPLAVRRFAGTRLPLLYVAGDMRSVDLEGVLSAEGIPVRTVVAYKAAPAAEFPKEARTGLEQQRVDGVLHFSRRSVETYLALSSDFAEQALAPVQFCLSEGIAEPLRSAGGSQIMIAAHPDERNLLACVASAATPMPSSNRLE